MAISAAQVVAYVKTFIGGRYVYGATGPSAFDCSGLTQHVYKSVGVSLPRTSEEQFTVGAAVPAAQAAAGDLVFFGGDGYDGSPSAPGHVGIYIGGGQMVSALNPAAGIKVSSVAGNVGFRRPTGVAGGTLSPATTGSSSGTGGGGSSFTSALGGIFNDLTSGLVSWPGQIIGTFSDLDTATVDVYNHLKLFFQPSTYIRIGAGMAGTTFLVMGLVCLVREAKDA